MDQGDMDYLEDDQIQENVDRYLQMLDSGNIGYFDVTEFEGIIDTFIEEDNLEDAQTALHYGFNQHPNSLSLRKREASVYTLGGQYFEALSTLEYLRKIESDNYDIYIMAGDVYIHKDEIEKAFSVFQKAISLAKGEEDDAFYQIGCIFQQNDNAALAEKFLLIAHEKNPRNENALFELAYCYEKNNKPQESIHYYNKYLDIDPFSSTVWYNLGIVYNQTEMYDKAIECYDYTLALSDDFKSALFNKANTLANAHRYREAIESYLEYLKEDPTCADAYLYIGECYSNLSEPDKSYKFYEKCIHLDPNNSEAWYNAGRILMFRKKYYKAYRLFRQALQLDPERPVLALFFANVAEAIGKRRVARRFYFKSNRFERDAPQFWLLLAECYGSQGKVKSAISILKKAHSKFEENTVISCRLAAYLLEINDQENAMTYLEDALKIDAESYNDLFNYYPKAKHCEPINQLISQYRKLKQFDNHEL